MNDILHDIAWVVPLRNDFLTPLFEFFTWLGYPTFMMLLLPLGYWIWSKEKMTRVAVIVIVSTIINAFLKDFWENPRPDIAFRLDAEVGKSFGMPSGHAQVSAVLWFWIAYELSKAWAWAFATVIVLGICSSRIYLGIHDLEDILVGLGLAAISLLAYRYFLIGRFKKARIKPLWGSLLLVFSAGIVTYLAWPPAEQSMGVLVVFGLLFTWILGDRLESSLVNFKPRRERWSLVLIATIGVAGLMSLLAAAKPLLSGLDPLLGGTVNSALLGLYMTLGAPMLFKLCRLNATP